MKNNNVSIIIPTKNSGDILERCLASIINPFRKSVDGKRFADLDYPKDNYEVIIVNGHSTDDNVGIELDWKNR